MYIDRCTYKCSNINNIFSFITYLKANNATVVLIKCVENVVCIQGWVSWCVQF